MKRKFPIKRVGKKTLEWIKAREKLINIFSQKGIKSCELDFDGCWKNNSLNFAHRYKRSDPRTKHVFSQVILCCNQCHQKIEYDKDLTEEVFKKLRL